MTAHDRTLRTRAGEAFALYEGKLHHPNGVSLPMPGYRPTYRPRTEPLPKAKPVSVQARLMAVITADWQSANAIIAKIGRSRGDYYTGLRSLLRDRVIEARPAPKRGMEYRLAQGGDISRAPLYGADLAAWRYIKANPQSQVKAVADTLGHTQKNTRRRLARLARLGYISITIGRGKYNVRTHLYSVVTE